MLALRTGPHQALLQKARRSFAEQADGEQFLKWVEERLLAALPQGRAVSVQDKHAALQCALADATAEAYAELQRKRPRDEEQPARCVGGAAHMAHALWARAVDALARALFLADATRAATWSHSRLLEPAEAGLEPPAPPPAETKTCRRLHLRRLRRTRLPSTWQQR